jgi:hypothetical protein
VTAALLASIMRLSPRHADADGDNFMITGADGRGRGDL